MVAPPVIHQILSPLQQGLQDKNGILLSASCSVKSVFSNQHDVQGTLYIGQNFALQMKHSHYQLANLVHNLDEGGFVMSTFFTTKLLRGMELTAGGQRIWTIPNAGGNSVISEVLSFELLARCFNARLMKTEMEVHYFPYGGSITDYVIDLFETTVGVSVTRAMKFMGEYTVEDAHRLLNKKLKGVIQSSNNTLDRWEKQILHVWSTSHHVTGQLARAYADLDPEVKANTVVMITTASDADHIFKNG